MNAVTTIVQDIQGYNSWPMIQAFGESLVCTYSRGTAHSITEGCRGVFARVSSDGGRSWSPESVICNDPARGEVTIGKGLDADGAMLLWVRSCAGDFRHTLYRSWDGVTFQAVVTPPLNPMPVQITDIFHLPSSFMALWFAGNYSANSGHSWGTLTSTDNGLTWYQRTIEEGLPKDEWPTEQSAVYLGDGRILAIARVEETGAPNATQFQLLSRDFGRSWTRFRTNIGDVKCSTPSLLLVPASGLVCNYYFQRGAGLLKRRTANIQTVLDEPTSWPAPEVIAHASTVHDDAGNVNATRIGKVHFLAYYSGKAPDTAILLTTIAAPQ